MSNAETVKETKKAAKTAAQKMEGLAFDIAKPEFPEVFREMAEKGVEQAKENYARMRNAAEEVTDVMEDTYLHATRGITEFNLKTIEVLRANTNSGFDYARELLAAKSLSEAVELSTSHMRQQFEAFSAQAKEFSALAQKVATETSEPFKSSVSKNLN